MLGISRTPRGSYQRRSMNWVFPESRATASWDLMDQSGSQGEAVSIYPGYINVHGVNAFLVQDAVTEENPDGLWNITLGAGQTQYVYLEAPRSDYSSAVIKADTTRVVSDSAAFRKVLWEFVWTPESSPGIGDATFKDGIDRRHDIDLDSPA
jgi:hypothetical protein